MKMLPFDLEKAKAGHPIVQRCELPAKFLSQEPGNFPLRAAVQNYMGQWYLISTNRTGYRFLEDSSPEDLFLLAPDAPKATRTIRVDELPALTEVKFKSGDIYLVTGKSGDCIACSGDWHDLEKLRRDGALYRDALKPELGWRKFEVEVDV